MDINNLFKFVIPWWGDDEKHQPVSFFYGDAKSFGWHVLWMRTFFVESFRIFKFGFCSHIVSILRSTFVIYTIYICPILMGRYI